MSRESFMQAMAEYEQAEPFTYEEKRSLTLQNRNFIRGIQIATGVSKREAMERLSMADSSDIAALSDAIASSYERETGGSAGASGIMGAGSGVSPGRVATKDKKKRKKGAEKGAPKGAKYKYAGVVLQVREMDKNRFQRIKESGTRQRYIDTKTGEDISRRERDKRLARIVTTY